MIRRRRDCDEKKRIREGGARMGRKVERKRERLNRLRSRTRSYSDRICIVFPYIKTLINSQERVRKVFIYHFPLLPCHIHIQFLESSILHSFAAS